MALAVERRIHPNSLSYIRMYGALPQALLILWSPYWAAAAFGLLAFTDYLDGSNARRTERTSLYGEMLDPRADKVLVYLNLVVLLPLTWGALIGFPLGLVLAGLVVLDILSEVQAQQQYWSGRPRHTNWLGKAKTVLLFGIILQLAALQMGEPSSPAIILGCFVIALACSTYSWMKKEQARWAVSTVS